MGQQYCSNVAHLSVCENLIRIPSKISCTFSITHSAGTLFDFFRELPFIGKQLQTLLKKRHMRYYCDNYYNENNFRPFELAYYN